MRITELFLGFGRGGAERAALSRLRYSPADYHTTFLVVGDKASVDTGLSLAASTAGITVCGSGPREMAKAVRESRPNVLVINTPRHAIQLLLSQRKKLPFAVVVVAHSELVSENPARARAVSWPLCAANRRADLHIAVSRNAASGAWCRGAKRVAICHLGSELEISGQSQGDAWPRGTAIRLLAISRLTLPKNLSALVQAIYQSRGALRRAGAHLVIVGDGPEKGHLLQEVSSKGLWDLVSFAGHSDAPGDWLAAADWLLIPSSAEGGPLTAYEGMQAGVRIMGTSRGAIPDVIRGDKDSVLLVGSDVSTLVSGLHRLLSSPPTLEPIHRARRMEAGKVWSAQALVPHWYRTLASVV